MEVRDARRKTMFQVCITFHLGIAELVLECG